MLLVVDRGSCCDALIILEVEVNFNAEVIPAVGYHAIWTRSFFPELTSTEHGLNIH